MTATEGTKSAPGLECGTISTGTPGQPNSTEAAAAAAVIAPTQAEQERVNVFVLLAHSFGADLWRERQARGGIPGLNEPLPYGYYRAAGSGWSIKYSQDAEEDPITRLVRRALTRLLGFDLVHAWRNRGELFEADIVWAHTEREHLAALLLRLLCGRERNPRIIAECMWLPDTWASFSRPKRAVYRWLLARAEALTSQSYDGASWLRALLPNSRVEYIPSGAVPEFMRRPRRRPVHQPVRIAALGGDMHRDWPTLFAALGGDPGFELRVASSKATTRSRSRMENVTIAAASTESDVRHLYEWADIVVVPLKPNLHVSGRTVIFEAVALAVPVIATGVGGLQAYFPNGELCFVPPRDPSALRQAAIRLASDDEDRFNMTVAAQRRAWAAGLTTQAYAESHRKLSRALLAAQRLRRPASTAHNVGTHTTPSTADTVRVFVLLGHTFGAERWRNRFARHEIPGLNDALPYGYHRAAGDGWSIQYSEDADEAPAIRFARRALTRILGLELIHTWRNRRPLLAADIVWTHTERESLAVLLLLRLLARGSPPRVVANCIWLFDRWTSFSRPRRAVYRWLLKGADVITTHSPENLAAAQRLLPTVRSRLMLFGVASPDDLKRPQRTHVVRPVRVAALGGDMHRDWETLLSALGGSTEFELRIASIKSTFRRRPAIANVTVRPARNEGDVKRIYDWADVAVVALKPNLHASGITVILEAVVSGVPVVATDTGGLRAYFSGHELSYVPARDPAALRESVRQLAEDPGRRFEMVMAAQRRFIEAALTSEGHALRHRALSEELLATRAGATSRQAHALA